MKKFLFMFCAVMALSVSAFAVDANHFCGQTISSTFVYVNSNAVSNNGDVYFFLRAYTGNGTRASLYGITFNEGSTVTFTRGSTTSTVAISGNSAVVDGVTVYYKVISDEFDSATSNPSLYMYPLNYGPGWSGICSDFVSWYNDYGGGIPSGDAVSFALPCGNVAYFQVSSAQTVNFKSTYQILSKFFANSTYGYWSDSGQRFGPAASLPTSSTSFPIASQDPLYWTPDPQSKNFLGLSKTGLASESCIIGQWYAFYNPTYNSNNTDWTTMDITGATVLISGSFSAIKIFPLEQVVDYQNGAFVSGSNDDYQSYFDGNIGADGTVSFTNQDGVSSVPTAGGQNLLAPNETAQSLIDKVVGILQNLLSEIQSLFTFGYDAIQSLVGVMSSFVSSFSQLYTWLPTEVHSALISAVIIAVVIGIFKVFL